MVSAAHDDSWTEVRPSPRGRRGELPGVWSLGEVLPDVLARFGLGDVPLDLSRWKNDALERASPANAANSR